MSETRAARPPAGLLQALTAAMARPMEQPLEEDAFDAIARAVFAWQFEHNRPYAAYCRRRGRTPDSVTHWSAVPAVPTAAFKEVELVVDTGVPPDAVFRTSGTTGGERRGVHVVPDLSLYHQSLLPNFAAMLLPDGVRPAMFSLVPPPRDMPDSSLSHMIATVIERLGSATSGWHASTGAGIDHEGLDRALQEACSRREVTCLLGTSFSFVHWLDALEAKGRRYRLPEGSRLMDTGGFKGRSREINEDQLRDWCIDRLGIPPTHCINEYGMTELCSQFYDSTLREIVLGRLPGPRHKVPPPWVRTRVVDAESLQPVEPGRSGLLQHFDLANLGSVMAVQTEDIGVEVKEGFRVLGRAAGAQARGCSIAMDDLLMALGRGRQPGPGR